MDKTQETWRPSEVARLSRLLHACDHGLSVCSISGPGGVGKTYLVDQVLSSERPQELGYIRLSVNAVDSQTRVDFFGLIEELAKSSLPPPAQPSTDYFPQTRRVADAHQKLVERAAAELDANGVSEETKEVAVKLLLGAQFVNKMVPKSRNKRVEAGRGVLKEWAPADIDGALKAVDALKSLNASTFLGQSLQARVRRNLFKVTADALVSDLTSTIVGDKRWGRLKLTQRPIEGVSRLLIVLDDYEALAPVLGEFLVESLVPRLADAQFPTLLIVGCRDDLEATHPGWSQHAKSYLREQIRLSPFDKETAFGLLAEAGIAEERWAQLYEATQGLPFLLTLVIEEATAPDVESALFAKKYFDRTTRWMTPKEREWFVAVCYLDTINEDTLRVLFPEEEVPSVQNWFEREASIRDPASRSFRMRSLVREKALRYLEMRSPSRHREMLRKAKGAAEDAALGGPSRVEL